MANKLRGMVNNGQARPLSAEKRDDGAPAIAAELQLNCQLLFGRILMVSRRRDRGA